MAAATRIALSIAAVVLLAACAAGGTDGRQREVLVSAAASLTDAFTEIEASFEAGNPAVDVVLNFAGSATLAAQIVDGAPVDVFASADPENLSTVLAAGAARSEPVVFARNDMRIAVPSGNPAGVTSLEDLARDDLLVGLCDEGVPCGDLARDVLDRAGVEAAVDTNEPNVRALLTKLELGELDVGIVYTTDVLASGAVDGIAIPPAVNAGTQYPIVVVAPNDRVADARAFVAFVTSSRGETILADHGFSTP